jgi:hypothetical protein
MKFKATDEQVKEVVALAINASVPAGMGFLHFDPSKVFRAADIKIGHSGDMRVIDVDYAQGRMVKLLIRESATNPGIWQVVRPAGSPTPDYQSWISTYPSLEKLLEAAGIGKDQLIAV